MIYCFIAFTFMVEEKTWQSHKSRNMVWFMFIEKIFFSLRTCAFFFFNLTVKMFLCCWLTLVTLVPVALSTNPGVEIKLTQKGLEYGKHCNTSLFFQLKNSSKLSSKFPFARQTTGNGFNPEETQKYQSPRFFRERESVSNWEGPVQPVKVRWPFIKQKGGHFLQVPLNTSMLFLPVCK